MVVPWPVVRWERQRLAGSNARGEAEAKKADSYADALGIRRTIGRCASEAEAMDVAGAVGAASPPAIAWRNDRWERRE